MAIPGTSLEIAWRNNIQQVSKFLNEKHGVDYMIFNLSGESYNYKKFHHQVKDFGFPDHR